MGLLAASQMNSDSNSRCDAFVVYAARVLYSHSPLELSYSPLSLFLAVSRALLSQPFVCSLSLSHSLSRNGCFRVDLTMLRQQRRHRRRQH